MGIKLTTTNHAEFSVSEVIHSPVRSFQKSEEGGNDLHKTPEKQIYVQYSSVNSFACVQFANLKYDTNLHDSHRKAGFISGSEILTNRIII